ncbi:MAG: single-stranded DNA-binding protein [Clostridia bacterium]|nr:single-stranded DNA-binding protein [Clostridia bacterium]
MNMLHIIGNLTGNPESRIVSGQNGPNTVCNFTVATNRYARGQKVTEYFRITLWNQQAENAMKYLSKGRQVAVTGPVTARAYIGSDNEAHCTLEIQDVKELEYGQQPRRNATGNEPDYMPPDDSCAPLDDSEVPF